MKNLLKNTIFFFNSLIIISLLSSIISPFINPNLFWPISFFGLFFPIIISFCLIFTVFWYFFNHKCFWVNFIFLLLSIPFLSRYITFNNNNSTNENDIKVMSYNVRLFNKWGWIDKGNIKQEFS